MWECYCSVFLQLLTLCLLQFTLCFKLLHKWFLVFYCPKQIWNKCFSPTSKTQIKDFLSYLFKTLQLGKLAILLLMENYWILSKNPLLHKIYHSCFILVDLYLLRSKQGKYWNYKKGNLLAVSILFSKQGQNNCFNAYDITEIWYNISIISSFDIENVKQLWAVYMAFPFIPTNQAKLQFARHAY